MKVAYVTTYDARNVSDGWSGTGYYIAQSLMQQSLSVHHIGPLQKKTSWLFDLKEKYYSRLAGKRYLPNLEPSVMKYYANQVERMLTQIDYDIILSLGYYPIAYLRSKKPMVLWGDATFSLIKDYHPKYRNLCSETIKKCDIIEREAHKNCSLLIYSTKWAAESAIKHYKVDSSKVKVVPFGANLNCNRTVEDIRSIINSRPSNRCNLLFVGRDWYWKGGEVAFELTKKLNEFEVETQLTILGCKPPFKEPLPSFVQCLDFVNKSSLQGIKMIESLFAKSHFLIHPTKAECFGLVVCEANSFGVPCLVNDTGGISTIIRNERNGKVILGNRINDYCKFIIPLMKKYTDYKTLALSSFNEYRYRLNWSVAGQKVKRLLREMF